MFWAAIESSIISLLVKGRRLSVFSGVKQSVNLAIIHILCEVSPAGCLISGSHAAPDKSNTILDSKAQPDKWGKSPPFPGVIHGYSKPV
jgi:hypothetical protein